MSIKIVSPRKQVTVTDYALHYETKATPGSGFTFDCNEFGVLLPIAGAAKMNLQYCLTHADEFYGPSLQDFSHQYTEPAVGLCHCGSPVELYDPMDNDCVCGRCYNMSGQEVTPNYGRAECHADGLAYDENDY